MSAAPRRRWRHFLVFFLLFCGAAFYAFDPLLEHALHKLATRLEGSGHRVDFSDVDVDLFHGDLHIQGLSMVPVDSVLPADSTTRFILHAEEVDLEGVRIWSLLTEHVLHARSFIVHAPSMEHSFATHMGRRNEALGIAPTAQQPSAFPLIKIDSLVIDDASASSTDRKGIRPSVAIAQIDLVMQDVSMAIGAYNRPIVERSVARLDLRGIAADLPPLYHFGIDSVRVRYPEVSTRIYGMALTSTVDPKTYHTLVDKQVDLLGIKADSLTLTGSSILDQISDGSYRADVVELFGGVFHVHRDKSIPAGPQVYEPLPAAALLGLPVSLAVDTLRAVQCEVRYSERMKRGDAYGTIAFTHIDGLLTGLSNAPDTAPADLHLHGTARIAGKGRAMLDLRMPMRTHPVALSIHAQVHDIPASLLNRMTDNLMHVNATSGYIHLLDLKVKADDKQATGTADMRYEDLHMELNNSVEHAGLLSKVANMVVRTRNMPHQRHYRLGRIHVQRKQHASVFNYLWLTIKAGCMDVVLHTSVAKGVETLNTIGAQ